MPGHSEEALPLTSRVPHEQELLDDDHPSDISLEKSSPRTSCVSSWIRHQLVNDIWTWTKGGVRTALPRFLTGDLPDTTKLSSTAYLDALRGWASWTVFNFHHLVELHTQMPKYNFLAAGKPAVVLFFVISGYALSCGFVSTSEPAVVMSRLASSTFRRWLRLFLPVAVGMFINMLAVQFNLTPVNSPLGPSFPTFRQHLIAWMRTLLRLSNPFSVVAGYHVNEELHYGYQLWTIPVEFRGSIVLFLYLAVSYRLTKIRRLLLILVTIPALFYWDATYVALFLSGYALALVAPANGPRLPTVTEGKLGPPGRQELYQKHRDLVMIIPFLIAAWLFHLPRTYPHIDSGDVYFPWQYLTPFPIKDLSTVHWAPEISAKKAIEWKLVNERSYQVVCGLASVVMIFCLQRSKYLRWPLETRIMQYMGQLSFGMYVTHLLVVVCFFSKYAQPWREAQGPESIWNTYFGYLVCYLAMMVIVLVAADWFDKMDRFLQSWVRKLWEWFSPKV